MKVPDKIIVCVVLSMINCAHCLDPFTIGGIIALTSSAISGILYAWNSEGCRGNWIEPDLKGLAQNLDKHVHGQHLVKGVVVRALIGHLQNDKPKKALVLSFHGWTGGGKNYVSNFIAESLFYRGKDSNNVHLYVSTKHFPRETEVESYKLKLQKDITDSVTNCHRSLFIFDEIDKMPLGLIDAIKPFIDYHEKLDGVDFRNSIFLFLSNTGGTEVTRLMLKRWKEGKKRDDITHQDMESLIEKGAFKEIGGLHKSDIILHNLIDYYVPFLPLERKHVELCAKEEFKRRGKRPTAQRTNQVVDKLIYWPKEAKLFSTTGCKRVAQKVSFILADEDYDNIFD
ncbi:unnamed protein product [Meganyctiphanes norvegica]|uniref:Torsin-1A C-terminal domain-containing protein n=1 Tax=Meganyctiphanes norvegica TaxID=48144 RepID=A0AAV2PJ02_MEGNR